MKESRRNRKNGFYTVNPNGTDELTQQVGKIIGWVAIIMVPFAESFIRHFEISRKNKGGSKK